MSFPPKLRIFAAVLVILIAAGVHAEAQRLTLSVTSSASSLRVSNNLSYTIILTNNFAFLPSALVSNTLPATVQFVSATPSTGGTFTTNGNGVVFNIGAFNIGTFVQMTLTVRPTQVGFVTNLVQFYTPNATNAPSASLVTQVTNAIPPQADLGVAITVPTTSVIAGDPLTYGVSVTNAGPNAAPNVVVTNMLPPGVVFKSVLPTNQTYTVIRSNVVFSLGTLTNGSSRKFQLTVQSTNAGVLPFSAFVNAPGMPETNMANNFASTNITVLNYFPGDLVAVTNSAQIPNPQNGLIEQSILVSNVGTNDVAAVRVVVTGLTNRLFNASGTNSGNPFVVYAVPLATNQSVTLLLQYDPRKNFPLTNSQLHAYAVPPPNLTPPIATSSSTNVTITRIVRLTNGNLLIEFPSLTNRTYTVVYSDNLLFSNAAIAPPSIVAPANRVQWIDYGPPTTISAPASSGSRFYRVFLNP